MVQYFETQSRPDLGTILGQSLGQGLQLGMQNQFNTQEQSRQEQRQLQFQEIQQQRQRQMQQQELSSLQQAISKAGDNPQSQLQAILLSPVSNETKKLFGDMIINQQKASTEQQKANLPKAPIGGLSGQPVPGEIGSAIQNVIQSNPNVSADQLALAFDSAGVPRTYSNSYIENRRRQDEAKSKSGESREAESRKETSKLRSDIAEKAQSALQGIENKERLLELVDTGNLNDPTYAATLDALPFNYGKRLLSPESVEYKAGLVEEFKDLRNIFQGQTRVSEINILENKIADLYFTDEQKRRILKSRINALNADVLRSEVASEIEEEKPGLGILQFNKELTKRIKERAKPIADQSLDDLKNIVNEAESRKSRQLDVRNPEDAQIAIQILKEAGGNKEEARRLAKKKGYKL